MTIECQKRIDVYQNDLSSDTSQNDSKKMIKDPNQVIEINSITELKSSSDPLRSVSSNSIRCEKCQKKLRLAQQFQCKCRAFFCSAHKYADTHACSFDFKKEWRDALDSKNPKINGKKIEKI